MLQVAGICQEAAENERVQRAPLAWLIVSFFVGRCILLCQALTRPCKNLFFVRSSENQRHQNLAEASCHGKICVNFRDFAKKQLKMSEREGHPWPGS